MAKNRTQQKHKKNKNAEKRIKKSVSAVVFTNSVPNFGGGLQENTFLLKMIQKSGFGIS